MTDERQLAVAYLGVALVCAAGSRSTPTVILVAFALFTLLLGYRRRSKASAAAAGLALYYPLALLFGRVVPGGWSFIASATVLIPLSERLAFEYEVSTTLKAPPGIDEESKNQLARLSKAHGLRLVWFAAGAAAVAASSLVASKVAAYSSVLAAASVLLLFVVWAYARR